MDKILMPAFLAHDRPQLLQRPIRAWVCGHVHVSQTARAVLDNNQYVQDPELDQQLMGNSLLIPEGILHGHTSNQVAQFRWNWRSAGPALPAPEDPPAQSMPANDGRRSHADNRRAPIEHSREQCEADASGVIQAPRFDATLDITRQLLTKNQVLSADRAGRAQERDDQPQDVEGRPNDCACQLQHALIMPESACVCRRRTSKCPRRELLRTTIRNQRMLHGLIGIHVAALAPREIERSVVAHCSTGGHDLTLVPRPPGWRDRTRNVLSHSFGRAPNARCGVTSLLQARDGRESFQCLAQMVKIAEVA